MEIERSISGAKPPSSASKNTPKHGKRRMAPSNSGKLSPLQPLTKNTLGEEKHFWAQDPGLEHLTHLVPLSRAAQNNSVHTDRDDRGRRSEASDNSVYMTANESDRAVERSDSSARSSNVSALSKHRYQIMRQPQATAKPSTQHGATSEAQTIQERALDLAAQTGSSAAAGLLGSLTGFCTGAALGARNGFYFASDAGLRRWGQDSGLLMNAGKTLVMSVFTGAAVVGSCALHAAVGTVYGLWSGVTYGWSERPSSFLDHFPGMMKVVGGVMGGSQKVNDTVVKQ